MEELTQKDYGIILEKLERMEGFLKSYLASLEEPLETKGRRRIIANNPIVGTLDKWHRKNGEVQKNDFLCRITWGSFGVVSGRTDIYAPARGILRIIVGEGEEVTPGQTIATLDEIIEL